MTSQEGAKQLLLNAWQALWVPDLSTLSDYFALDAEMSAFTFYPPKQTTYKGLEALTAVRKESLSIPSSET